MRIQEQMQQTSLSSKKMLTIFEITVVLVTIITSFSVSMFFHLTTYGLPAGAEGSVIEKNSICGDGDENTPCITDLSRYQYPLNGPDFNLEIYGSNFVNNGSETVYMFFYEDGTPEFAPLETNYNATEDGTVYLIARIKMDGGFGSNYLPIYVRNWDNNNQRWIYSNSQTLTILNPQPAVTYVGVDPTNQQEDLIADNNVSKRSVYILGSGFVPFISKVYQVIVENDVLMDRELTVDHRNSTNSRLMFNLNSDEQMKGGGRMQIKVVNPKPGGGEASGVLNLLNPIPIITDLDPKSINVINPPEVVRIAGRLFNKQSKVYLLVLLASSCSSLQESIEERGFKATLALDIYRSKDELSPPAIGVSSIKEITKEITVGGWENLIFNPTLREICVIVFNPEPGGGASGVGELNLYLAEPLPPPSTD